MTTEPEPERELEREHGPDDGGDTEIEPEPEPNPEPKLTKEQIKDKNMKELGDRSFKFPDPYPETYYGRKNSAYRRRHQAHINFEGNLSNFKDFWSKMKEEARCWSSDMTSQERRDWGVGGADENRGGSLATINHDLNHWFGSNERFQSLIIIEQLTEYEEVMASLAKIRHVAQQVVREIT